MAFDGFNSSDDSSIIFRDVVTLALVGIVALVIILLSHINPPGDQASADVAPPGNVIIEITWSSELDDDIDLWVQAPGDVPVGYSNKGGRFFNLLRDDLGHSGDPSDVNLETAYTRGIPAGEYTVNVHFYRHKSKSFPVEVNAVVRVKADADASSQTLLSRAVQLDRQGHELTVFRFQLTPEGKIVQGSVNTLARALRST